MTFLQQCHEGVRWDWRLHRPDRFNAIGPSMAADLNTALDHLCETLAHQDTTAPRLLVIRAATHKGIWIAGGDLKELSLLPARADGAAYAASMQRFCLGLETLPIPVLMLLDGAAIGGGAELLLAADYVIATAEARVQFKQLHIGLPTGYGGAWRLQEKIGAARAMALLLEGAKLDAHALWQLGLVHKIADDEAQLMSLLNTMTQQVTALSPEAVRAQKAMLLAARGPGREAGLMAEAQLFADAWFNPTHQHFLRQFTTPAP